MDELDDLLRDIEWHEEVWSNDDMDQYEKELEQIEESQDETDL